MINKLFGGALVAIVCSIASIVSAQQLNEFKNGELADAEALNENFETLRPWTEFYGSGSYFQWNLKEFEVNCSGDPSALQAIWNETMHLDRVKYSIMGSCDAPAVELNAAGDQVLSGTLFGVQGGRFIQIDGFCSETGPAGELVMNDWGFVVNNGGSAILSCLRLANEPRLQVFANSYLRVQGVRPSSIDKMIIGAFDGGIVRLFGNGDTDPVFIDSIYISNGGVLRFNGLGNWYVDTVSISDATVRISAGTSGNIVNFYSEASSVKLESTSLNVDSLILKFNSRFRVKCVTDDLGACVTTGVGSLQTFSNSEFYEYID